GSRHGEQLLHHNHTRGALQSTFHRDALIVRAVEQLIERRIDLRHVVDRLVLGRLRRERIAVEGGLQRAASVVVMQELFSMA
ncbi:hypothetical protein, partial [Mycobacterium kubicae]|uniref:hypothetical protein n=1 Tax=Mycobacterium kubicae TaxID=120959 RepID=UPI001A9699E3